MIMKGLRSKGTYQNGSMGNRKCYNSLLIKRHALWVIFCTCNWKNSRAILLYIPLILEGSHWLQSEEDMRIEGVQSAEMVGKRCQKELVGDFEKWRSREKVWEKME